MNKAMGEQKVCQWAAFTLAGAVACRFDLMSAEHVPCGPSWAVRQEHRQPAQRLCRALGINCCRKHMRKPKVPQSHRHLCAPCWSQPGAESLQHHSHQPWGWLERCMQMMKQMLRKDGRPRDAVGSKDGSLPQPESGGPVSSPCSQSLTLHSRTQSSAGHCSSIARGPFSEAHMCLFYFVARRCSEGIIKYPENK